MNGKISVLIMTVPLINQKLKNKLLASQTTLFVSILAFMPETLMDQII